MEKMKKFFKYVIWIVLFYLFTEGIIYLATKEFFRQVDNYTIQTSSPAIQVSEFKASDRSGTIKGTVTNNTGEHIKECYLKIELYNKNNKHLGTEYKDLKYFNINEKIPFEILFNYHEIDNAKISITYEKDEKNNDEKFIKLGDDFYEHKDAWTLFGVLTFLYFI